MRINCKIAIKLTITQVLFHWTAFLGHILDFIFYSIVPRESTEITGYFYRILTFNSMQSLMIHLHCLFY